jgi:hypothetical protein
VTGDQIDAIEQRDQGFQKLQDLTTICFVWAVGLLALLSVVAAVTIPGQTQNTGTSNNPTDTSIAPTTEDGQTFQGPVAGSFQPGGGRPIAVSGGSH